MLDPLTPTSKLLDVVRDETPHICARHAKIVDHKRLTKLDLIFLQDKLRILSCAVNGLLQRTNHDQPYDL